MDVDEFIIGEWQKVKNSCRVLSIKNTINKITAFSGTPQEEAQKALIRFLFARDDALFLNSNQVIDSEGFYARYAKIENTEQLGNILVKDYYIFNIDAQRLQELFKHLTPVTQIVAEAEKSVGYQIFSEELQNNLEIIQERIFWWNQQADQRTQRRIGLHNYLARQSSPQKLYRVVDDLCELPFFPSRKEFWLAWQDCRCKYLLNGYGILTPQTAADVITWSQWMWKESHQLGDEFLEQAVANYVSKKGSFSADDIIAGLGHLGFEVEKEWLEKLLLEKLDCHRDSPHSWSRNRRDSLYYEADFAVLWEKSVAKWEQALKPKQKYIFKHRILGGKTLEETGQGLGVSRERVRQIEHKTLLEMRLPAHLTYIIPYYEALQEVLIRSGYLDLFDWGLCPEDYGQFDFIFETIIKTTKFVRVYEGLVLQDITWQGIKNLITGFSGNGLVKVEQLRELIRSSLPPHVYRRIFTGIWGMVEVEPGSYYYSRQKKLSKEEEVCLVIYRAGRPLHFTEAEALAGKFGLPFSFEGKSRNILATMQRSQQLKRVAPGTFAWKDWDITEHVFIRDLVYMVLAESGRPLYFEEIHQEVQKQRNDTISRNSVYAYINSHPDIITVYTKQYILLEWLEDEELLLKYGLNPQELNKFNQNYQGKVILDVFLNYGHYFTLYRLSEAYWQAGIIRLSRNVKTILDNRLVMIAPDGSYHLCSLYWETISGLKRWAHSLAINELFYLEIVNQRVLRCLKQEQYDNYIKLDDDYLQEAEAFWQRQTELEQMDHKENDEAESLPCSMDSLLENGLQNGFLSGKDFESIVNLGFHPQLVRHLLDERGIRVDW